MRASTFVRASTFAAVGVVSISSAYAASFTDIASSRNQVAIQYLSDKGIISGYSDGTFKPNATINRAELAKILVTANGANPTVDQYSNCFSDVTTDWFAPYVCYAKQQGWVTGYSDGTFRPNNPVNTAEAIKMILSAQGITASASASVNTYSDVDASAWYASDVETANSMGLLQTTRGTLGINDNMTRGLVAETIYRSLSIKASGATSFDASSEQGNQGQNRSAMMATYQQSLQQYLTQANAAPDKTTLTQDQFTTEMTNLRTAQMAKFQQTMGQNSSLYGQRSGQFSSRQGFNSSNRPNPLANATTFIKYTDPSGTEVLLALDASGNVIYKYPSSGFGGGRGGHHGASSSLGN